MAKITLIYYGLNKKLITSINFLDDFTLADNLIKNHKEDYLSSALTPAEAVDNDQEHLDTIMYTITRLKRT